MQHPPLNISELKTEDGTNLRLMTVAELQEKLEGQDPNAYVYPYTCNGWLITPSFSSEPVDSVDGPYSLS